MHKQVKAYLSQIGSRGGRVKSEAKAIAARINASKPRKKRVSSIDNVVVNGQEKPVAIAKPLC